VKRPRAMINDPDGKVHIVGPNTKIGLRNGYIAVIREGEIVVVETVEENGRLVSSAQIVKLAK
jgi:type IV pilus assembly protein PilP